MRNRRTFLYRLRTAITDGVTEKGSRRGVLERPRESA